MDLKIDPTTGDLALVNGDIVWVDGIDAIAQQIRIRLQMFKGEWYLDTRLGIPYFDEVFIKSPNQKRLDTIFRQAVQTTPGVASVPTFTAVLDSVQRTLTVKFVAVTDGGETINSEDYSPFIIDLSGVL